MINIEIRLKDQKLRDQVKLDLRRSGVPVGISYSTNGTDIIITIDTSQVYFLIEVSETNTQITFDEISFYRHYHELIFNNDDILKIEAKQSKAAGGESRNI